MKKRSYHRFTQEKIEYIRNKSVGNSIKDITLQFNNEFNVSVSEPSIQQIMHRNKIKNRMQAHNSWFGEGNTTWETGIKSKTDIEKKPDLTRKVGSVTTGGGQTWIKTEQPNTWELKHRNLWRKEHGKLKDTDHVLFKDGDKENITIENLFVAPNGVSAAVGKRGMKQDHAELNVTAHRLAELHIHIKRKGTNH